MGKELERGNFPDGLLRMVLHFESLSKKSVDGALRMPKRSQHEELDRPYVLDLLDHNRRGDNKPPMLEKHLYDSWKSRMELYMLNRPHGRMILASVEKGPLVWPSITEDGVTRLKEYIELTPAEAIQADCDIKAINIIL
ncbi:hypothetical protein Tco_1368324 [Tanacetum coccineum]